MVAALALVAAVAGTALAGPGSDANGSASTKKTASKALKPAKKNKKSIRNIELTPGPQGEKGGDGSANAASLATGRATGLPNSGGETRFYTPFGATSFTMEDEAATPGATVARDLAIELNAGPGGSRTLVFTLTANGNDGLTRTINEFDTTCNSGSQSMPSPADAKIALKSVAPRRLGRWRTSLALVGGRSSVGRQTCALTRRRRSLQQGRGLGHGLREHVGGDIEVGVHGIDVVEVVESLDKSDQGAGVCAGDLDRVLRLHCLL